MWLNFYKLTKCFFKAHLILATFHMARPLEEGLYRGTIVWWMSFTVRNVSNSGVINCRPLSEWFIWNFKLSKIQIKSTSYGIYGLHGLSSSGGLESWIPLCGRFLAWTKIFLYLSSYLSSIASGFCIWFYFLSGTPFHFPALITLNISDHWSCNCFIHFLLNNGTLSPLAVMTGCYLNWLALVDIWEGTISRVYIPVSFVTF